MTVVDTSIMLDRIGQLCHQFKFKLPTVSTQVGGSFSPAGHGDALPAVLKVLEQEAGIAATGTSTGCAGRPGCPRARLGKPPSSRGQALRV